MKILWTPWRLPFILSDKSEECLFCAKARENRDQENHILFRGRHSFIILNIYPYNNGHLMVVPYRHAPSLEDLDEATLGELMVLVQKSVVSLRQALSPEGFNIGLNLGQAAGAGIADHLHIHVVPRWSGDTNFMPVLAQTRLIPETLDGTYRRLKEAGLGE